MSLVNELRDLIRFKQAVSGRVVAVSNSMLQVATPNGIVDVMGDDNLQTGDAVTVQNGRAVKKSLNDDTPVFFV